MILEYPISNFTALSPSYQQNKTLNGHISRCAQVRTFLKKSVDPPSKVLSLTNILSVIFDPYQWFISDLALISSPVTCRENQKFALPDRK